MRWCFWYKQKNGSSSLTLLGAILVWIKRLGLGLGRGLGLGLKLGEECIARDSRDSWEDEMAAACTEDVKVGTCCVVQPFDLMPLLFSHQKAAKRGGREGKGGGGCSLAILREPC